MNAGKLVSILAIAVIAASIALMANAMITSAETPTAQTTPYEEKLIRLSVTGYGALSYSPSQATLTLGVLGQGSTATEALEECSSKAKAVVDALEKLGVSEDDMETIGVSVNPRYDWDSKPPKIVGYEATYTLRVLVRDLELTGKVIDAAFDAGADYMWGIQFTIPDEELKELQAEAIKLAVEDAYSQAKAIAEALGKEIVGVESVSLSPGYTPIPREVKLEAAGAPPILPPILPGEGTLTATVSIVYILQ